MTTSQPDAPDALHDLRRPSAASGGVFWYSPRQLMVFDADEAVRTNTENFADLTLPDRLVDLLRRRPSTPVSWKRVRSAWLAQMRRLTSEAELTALGERMESLLHARVDEPRNLIWLAHEVMFRSVVPMIIDGLPARDRARIATDTIAKLDQLMAGKEDPPLWRALRPFAIQIRAGLAVRRELRRRARHRVPAQRDLTQPIATDLLDTLGMDRAVEAVTTVLTAVSGPPGAAAACVMYGLVKHPEWAARLADESAGVDVQELYRSGVRSAPLAHRFVKEVLRLWPSPTMITRMVRRPLRVAEHDLEIGQAFVVSSAMVHHDPRHWRDPEVFDPDRWLPGAANGPTGAQHYVPFGWAPFTCVGAGLGMIQLVLLCRLLCTTFRVELTDPSAARMAVTTVSMPLDFEGRITPRS